MRIGIYYIATSQYKQGFEHFRKSIRGFLPEYQKTIVVLSDGLAEYDGLREDGIDYRVYHIDHFPWPLITLLKMRYILDHIDDAFDYICYFNGNLQANQNVSSSWLRLDKMNVSRHTFSSPDEVVDGEKFATIQHDSEAYIDKPYAYVHGGFFIAPAHIARKMCKDVCAMMEKDLLRNIIPQWHDESYLNKWCVENEELVVKQHLISYQQFNSSRPFAIIETIQKDRRTKINKHLNQLCLGGLGNTIFGIFHLMRQAQTIDVLCQDTELFGGVTSILFDDSISVRSTDLEITNEIKRQNCGNPHIVKNISYKNKETVSCFAQVMPDLEMIAQCRDRVKDRVAFHDYITVHVRRGDFLDEENAPYHPVMSRDYYEHAMKMFPNEKFLFVSDDIDWCKQNFAGDNIFFSDAQSSLQDFITLLGAKGCIYGNSTFGYMGALLNPRHKRVVCCRNWYRFGNTWNDDWCKLYPNDYPDELVLLNYLYT